MPPARAVEPRAVAHSTAGEATFRVGPPVYPGEDRARAREAARDRAERGSHWPVRVRASSQGPGDGLPVR